MTEDISARIDQDDHNEVSDRDERNEALEGSCRPARTRLPRLTDRLALGAKGLAVSPFCVGWVKDPDVIPAAFDAGINFFFVTVDMHWPIYEETRRGLAKLLRRRGVRERVVIAAVSYVTQSEFTYVPFQELLAAVPGLDHLDVLVIGGAYRDELPTRLAIYRDRVERGDFDARAVGATFHDRTAAVPMINDAAVDAAFVRCNPLHPGARTDVFPHLRPTATRLFNFNSMLGYAAPRALRDRLPPDHWRPRATDYYRFALSPPAVDGVLCSLHSPRQVSALGRAMASPPLDAEEQQYLIDLGELCSGNAELVSAGPSAAGAARRRAYRR